MTDRDITDHDRIRALADALEVHLAADRAPFDVAFARCRWALIRELTASLAMQRHAGGCAGAGREALRDGIGEALDGLMRDHVRNLSFVQLEDEWPDHCRRTGALLCRLRADLDHDDLPIAAVAAMPGPAYAARA